MNGKKLIYSWECTRKFVYYDMKAVSAVERVTPYQQRQAK
jgi:hypothetical protein